MEASLPWDGEMRLFGCCIVSGMLCDLRNRDEAEAGGVGGACIIALHWDCSICNDCVTLCCSELCLALRGASDTARAPSGRGRGRLPKSGGVEGEGCRDVSACLGGGCSGLLELAQCALRLEASSEGFERQSGVECFSAWARGITHDGAKDGFMNHGATLGKLADESSITPGAAGGHPSRSSLVPFAFESGGVIEFTASLKTVRRHTDAAESGGVIVILHLHRRVIVITDSSRTGEPCWCASLVTLTSAATCCSVSGECGFLLGIDWDGTHDGLIAAGMEEPLLSVSMPCDDSGAESITCCGCFSSCTLCALDRLLKPIVEGTLEGLIGTGRHVWVGCPSSLSIAWPSSSP